MGKNDCRRSCSSCSGWSVDTQSQIGTNGRLLQSLGMPNTTIAAVIMKATCAYMHPSQMVINCFKEPQHAVNAIQTLLDSDVPMAALLVDLSKAFERVNLYWILHILRMRSPPTWYVTMPNMFYLEGSYATKYRADYCHPELYMLELIWADLFRSSSFT